MMKESKEYEASLKSLETENYVDKVFYRPIGFFVAHLLRGTGITPNMVTIFSIFVGASAGYFFYKGASLKMAVMGILALVLANILDCVDGQLARLTGIKSKIGRILDGLAGDIWFICIYVGLALRLSEIYGTYLFFIPATLSGLSHLIQANITDYYKTLHLFFISKEKGAEFQTIAQVICRYEGMKPGLSKFFMYMYIWYTKVQVKITPKLQTLLQVFHERYGDDIPEGTRLQLRKRSKELMSEYLDFLTFNGRTLVMFITILTGQVWVYFLYEIIVLNIILALVIYRHERMCASFINEI